LRQSFVVFSAHTVHAHIFTNAIKRHPPRNKNKITNLCKTQVTKTFGGPASECWKIAAAVSRNVSSLKTSLYTIAVINHSRYSERLDGYYGMKETRLATQRENKYYNDTIITTILWKTARVVESSERRHPASLIIACIVRTLGRRRLRRLLRRLLSNGRQSAVAAEWRMSWRRRWSIGRASSRWMWTIVGACRAGAIRRSPLLYNSPGMRLPRRSATHHTK